jgi:hypothetical protein
MRDIPRHLYKYRSMNGTCFEFLRDIILQNKLFFSTPAAFNDPFDCAPALSMKATDAEFTEYLKGFFRRKYPHLSPKERWQSIAAIVRDPSRNHRSMTVSELLKKGFEDISNWIGVLSLSEVADDILMWSHYADSHQGVCLRFSSETGWFREAQEVLYEDERPVVNLIRDTPREYQEKAVLYKSVHWSYEKEWRVIDHSIPGHGVHNYDPAALDGIIIGTKTAENHISILKEWAVTRPKRVELLQAKIDPLRFGLIIDQV